MGPLVNGVANRHECRPEWRFDASVVGVREIVKQLVDVP